MTNLNYSRVKFAIDIEKAGLWIRGRKGKETVNEKSALSSAATLS